MDLPSMLTICLDVPPNLYEFLSSMVWKRDSPIQRHRLSNHTVPIHHVCSSDQVIYTKVMAAYLWFYLKYPEKERTKFDVRSVFNCFLLFDFTWNVGDT